MQLTASVTTLQVGERLEPKFFLGDVPGAKFSDVEHKTPVSTYSTKFDACQIEEQAQLKVTLGQAAEKKLMVKIPRAVAKKCSEKDKGSKDKKDKEKEKEKEK